MSAWEWQPLYRRLKDMMIKEETAQVIAYCDENKISYFSSVSFYMG